MGQQRLPMIGAFGLPQGIDLDDRQGQGNDILRPGDAILRQGQHQIDFIEGAADAAHLHMLGVATRLRFDPLRQPAIETPAGDDEVGPRWRDLGRALRINSGPDIPANRPHAGEINSLQLGRPWQRFADRSNLGVIAFIGALQQPDQQRPVAWICAAVRRTRTTSSSRVQGRFFNQS